MYSLAPLSKSVTAFDVEQPLTKMKSLSPTLWSHTSSALPSMLGSNASSPSMVAMVSCRVAPVHFAMRRMSRLSTRRTARMPASMRYFIAKSSIPLVVNTAVAPASTIFLILSLVISISFCLTFSNSAGSSMTMFTPIDMRCFLRSKSSNAILAGFTEVGISCEARIICSAYPFGMSTDSDELCPCDLRMFTWPTGYFALPSGPTIFTALIASTISLEKSTDSAPANLEAMVVFATCVSTSCSRSDTFRLKFSWMYLIDSRIARR
mmetsp:Transcript_55892/g.130865  ORF Transcript_55892/g.130865 Transcript_55892/m.130865 type:complete len:265 (+) Transcript_55892:562-1356(+)